MLIISIINLVWIKSIIYWWRYDFEFLLAFFIVKHSGFLLTDKLSHYLKIVVISSSFAVLIWILVRFVIWESILTYFGYSSKLSTWTVNEWPPIYHGIEWANFRRFQWIFDWPNQAAFFLVVYIWAIFHYLKNRKDIQVYLYFILFVSWWLIFLTWSRSSIIWAFLGLVIIMVLNFWTIIKKYKLQLAWMLIISLLLWSIFYVRYSWAINEIILRAWSSKWHSERMIIWFEKFKTRPMGYWLSQSWPAYRMTHDVKSIDEKYFIPESWYVQQLVEGWFIWLILFVSILGYIFLMIVPVSASISFSFIAVCVMNLVLHTFEASYVSILLFMIVWLFIKKKAK